MQACMMSFFSSRYLLRRFEFLRRQAHQSKRAWGRTQVIKDKSIENMLTKKREPMSNAIRQGKMRSEVCFYWTLLRKPSNWNEFHFALIYKNKSSSGKLVCF